MSWGKIPLENASWKFLSLEIKQKLLLVHFHCSFLLNQPFCVCYVSLIQKSNRFSLVDKHKKYALLRHKTTLEVSTWLYKQRWSSTRQNIPFETFEVTIYAILDTKRKKGAVFKQKSQLMDIAFTKTWHGVMLNKEILL